MVLVSRVVFITGGTGYLGSRLIAALVRRGHRVRALVRSGSEHKLPSEAERVLGNALIGESFAPAVAGADTFVQLVGVHHPSPRKAAEFLRVDLAAAEAGIAAALSAEVRHFVYVSVAQPAPVMKAYVAARQRAEQALERSRLPATVLRPWYVLGPGHYWPLVLLPLYWLLALVPGARRAAARLGLVTHHQMIRALVQAVEAPATGVRCVEVPGIRRAPPLDP
jgi:uncharacterized protein YbjT (DUF2867 family)